MYNCVFSIEEQLRDQITHDALRPRIGAHSPARQCSTGPWQVLIPDVPFNGKISAKGDLCLFKTVLPLAIAKAPQGIPKRRSLIHALY